MLQSYGDLTVFGRPFVKTVRLCYRSVVCLSVCPVLSCLSLTLVYCGQTAGWVNMKLGTEVGLGPGHLVSHGDPALPPQRGTAPQFSAHVCCGQTAGWIKMPLGMEVDFKKLSPGHIVLDGDSGPHQKRAQTPPIFGPCLLWPNG